MLETLESAKEQTYKNIELIVSDDCSTDETVNICKKWIEENKNRFVRTKLITVVKNSGISPNFNRGLKDAKGEWIKFIAGDDLLIDTCITTNLNLVKDSVHSFFFTMPKYIGEELSLINLFELGYRLFNKHSNQLSILLEQNCLPAAASFIRRSALKKMEGFDERFPMLEDYPMWIKAVNNNNKIIFNNAETVFYRMHDESISKNNASKENTYFYSNLIFYNSWFKFLAKVLIFEQIKGKMLIAAWDNLIELAKFKVAKISNNKKNYASIILFKGLDLLRPLFYFYWLNRIRKRLVTK